MAFVRLEENVVIESYEVLPDMHPLLAAQFISIDAAIGDYIDPDTGDNAGPRPDGFYNLVGGVWVEDTEATEVANNEGNPLIVSSSRNDQVVNNTGTQIEFDVTKKTSNLCHVDPVDATVIVFDKDAINASLGGFITVQSNGPRFSAAVNYSINNATTGIARGFSYLRNAGDSWDFAPKEIATQYMDFAEGDELRITVFTVEGTVYGQGGNQVGTIRGTASEFWIKE